jgi:hypothetical protein
MPAWLPAGARLVIKRQTETGISGELRLGRRTLARLGWSRARPEDDFELAGEHMLDAKGRNHGLEIERDGDYIQWCAEWVHGRQHGLAIQFDPRGRPLMVTEFVHGRGLDIWANWSNRGRNRSEPGEVHSWRDGHLHGYVWWGPPRALSSEEHFVRSKLHGITRRWDSDGALERGYPQFYVDDVKVTRRAYAAAQAADPRLPAYRAEDDRNVRAMPAAVRDAFTRAKQLRRMLTFLAQVRRQTPLRHAPPAAAPAPRASRSRRPPARRPPAPKARGARRTPARPRPATRSAR